MFKPKIPSERITKQEPTESTNNGASTSASTKRTTKVGKPSSLADRKPIKGKEREVIQIKATFENFKVEPKSRDTAGAGGGGSSRSGAKSSAKKDVKKAEKGQADSQSTTGKSESDWKKQYESDEEMELGGYFESSGDSDNERVEKPICWEERARSKLQPIKKEPQQATTEAAMLAEKQTRAELEEGKLILLPMIFGTAAGDTGYKLQVMRSGKMRLVNKTTGFCIDLVNADVVNAASHQNQASIKEVVEVEGQKLIRYGTLSDKDIYSPIRARGSA